MPSFWWWKYSGRATPLPKRERRMPEAARAMQVANELGADIGYRPRPIPSKPLPMVARFVPDPTHRHELRLHDGTGFADQVMDGGVRAVDPYQ